MAVLNPPFLYADLDDIRAHSPLRAGDLNAVIGTLPASALTKLIHTHSRVVDTYLSKRREVPLKITPHASITRYVALMVSCDLQVKLGEMPDSDQSDFRDSTRRELLDWIKNVASPDGYMEIPETNDKPKVSWTKKQTLASSQISPYPWVKTRK